MIIIINVGVTVVFGILRILLFEITRKGDLFFFYVYVFIFLINISRFNYVRDVCGLGVCGVFIKYLYL